MKQWQDFVESQPRANIQTNFICDASDLGLILVTGDDAQHFLQNQLSHDISLIDEEHHQLSAYSTPKGRMLGIFRVLQISNGYILITTKASVLPLLQRFHHYIVQAQVNLADASDHFARMALQTNNPQIINHPLLPVEIGQTLQNDDLISLQLTPLIVIRC